MTDDSGRAARAYARRGWRVFPLWWITEGGACACGRPCASPGKHPLGEAAPRGVLDATTDAATVRGWWHRWPQANVGVATGGLSGIVVLDEDPDDGGHDALLRLMDKHGDLDGFWLVLTGGDGRHIWFAAPSDVAIRCSAGQVGPGLDVRGDGGYVVAPPSNHASGQRYRWHPEHNPLRGELAPPPPWLVRAMTLAPAQRGGRFGTAAPVVGPIPEGRRDTTLASLAGSMRNRGLSPDEMLPSLRAVNARCVPPLDERDLERIARSIGRYRPPILLVS